MQSSIAIPAPTSFVFVKVCLLRVCCEVFARFYVHLHVILSPLSVLSLDSTNKLLYPPWDARLFSADLQASIEFVFVHIWLHTGSCMQVLTNMPCVNTPHPVNRLPSLFRRFVSCKPLSPSSRCPAATSVDSTPAG